MKKILIFGAVVLIVTIAYYVAEYFYGDAWRHYWHVKEMDEVYTSRRRGLGKRMK